MASDAFDRVIFRGKTMDKKTRAFLLAMEAKLGYELTVVQGCYNKGGVAASAGTHDLGGVVDLAAYDWKNKCKVAADLGGAAYHRPYIKGLWGEHIHLIIREHGNLSSGAAAQVKDWDSKPPRNGLKGHAPLDLKKYYHPGKKITFVYPVVKPTPAPKPTRVTQARDLLVEAIHDIGQAAALLDTTPETRTKAHAEELVLKGLRKELRASLGRLPKR